LTIVVAAGAAIGAALLFRNAATEPAVATQVPTQSEPVETFIEIPEADVLVAARQMRIGEVTTVADFRWASWPEASLNPNYLVKDVSPEAIDDLVGHVVRMPIFENEPIVSARLLPRGETGVLAAMLGAGMRAASVEISAETASGGFILPGDRVDVIMTHEIERQTADRVVTEVQSTVILENALVLAIDQTLAPIEGVDTAIGSIATLELSPEDSALLAFAEEKGTISLALRSMVDAVAAGDTVISRAGDFAAGREAGQVTVFRNGRVRESNAGGEE
ncbi:MAG: Flp pilus assembly protein CpaB, partial [Pseudomonadota bacterium]